MGAKKKSQKKGSLHKALKKLQKKSRQRKRKLTGWNRLELAVTLGVLLLSFWILSVRMSVYLRQSDKHLENAGELLADAEGDRVLPEEDGPCGRPEIIQKFIAPNQYSRSQIPLQKVKGLVIHYVANPGSSARDNRDYFEGLKDTHTAKASSHFIVGLSGEVIQCIPLDEISYASNQRNKDTISIECCHPDAGGKFNDKTYDTLVKLTAWLCDTYGLDSSDVIRHYDVTGKMCPVYYVKNEDAWVELRKNIQKRLDKR